MSRVGAALSRPVTPSTLPASDCGSETARSLARSGYGPALTDADALYVSSCVPRAESIVATGAVARTYERCESVPIPVKPLECNHRSTPSAADGLAPNRAVYAAGL